VRKKEEKEMIQTVAVLGSGVMGAGIAALLANSGCTVHLLDIVPKDATDRNVLAKGAIEKQLAAKPASGFTHPRNAKRITAGNLEDDLPKLAECDWIIEVVLEDIRIKQETYRKIEAHRRDGSIVSSNTSTLPLHVLTNGLPERFQRDFMITHFFNPPRFLPLLEVTGGTTCNPDHITRIRDFADVKLGKGVVQCKDTPGFLANRIGIFWMLVGLYEALDAGISVEDADAVMGKPVGIPKTALFGLFDLIGIDLMPLIAKAMLATLPEGDRFRALYHEPDIINTMIAEGFTGRKGKGGFYTMEKGADGSKQMFAKNLQTGAYAPVRPSNLASVEAAKGGLAALFAHPDKGGQYAKRVLVQVMHYAASLVPEISDDIVSIDLAMRLGFAWKYGVFELIDRLSTETTAGVDLLIAACEEQGLPIPPLLHAARGKRFYKTEGNTRYALTLAGEYAPLPQSETAWLLADKTLGSKPVLKNGSANLWDMGDGIACLQLTTKMNTIDDGVLEMIEKSIERVRADFKGLVIGTDEEQFSFGANLGFFMYVANLADWKTLSGVIKRGQGAVMGLKYAPFPVVASLSGMALGGGCEITLHCDAVAAHMESYTGLVEVGVGVIPAWGGCKEMLWRHSILPHPTLLPKGEGTVMSLASQEASFKPSPSGRGLGEGFVPQGSMPAISKAFETIMLAKVSSSAEEAREMLIVNDKSRISMNRRRVLPDAKQLCLALAESYAPPTPRTLRLTGESGKVALQMALDGFRASGKASPHDVVIGTHLATVLSGGDTDITRELTEQDVLTLEHDHFMELVKTQATRERISHMLETSKPLRN
jgi:3-hydroxyacyl-CoA dehydrogenase